MSFFAVECSERPGDRQDGVLVRPESMVSSAFTVSVRLEECLLSNDKRDRRVPFKTIRVDICI